MRNCIAEASGIMHVLSTGELMVNKFTI